MVECSNEYIYYKKSKNKRLKKLISLFLIFVILVSSFFYYRKFIVVNIENVCYSFVKQVISDTLNSEIINSITNNVEYEDVILIEKNASGDITCIKSNTKNVNKLSREIALFSSSIISGKLKTGVPIPILAFTGIRILSSIGRTVILPILTFSDVNCSFDSEFLSSGINQSLHKINCIVKVKIYLDLPTINKKEIVEDYQILLAETLIVGKVPNTYLGGNLFA